MSTVTYTRRLNTGAYEHAEATWTLNPDEHGLGREAAALEARRLVHLTLGLDARPPAAISPAPTQTATEPASSAAPIVGPAPSPLPAAQLAPAPTADGASASSFAGLAGVVTPPDASPPTTAPAPTPALLGPTTEVVIGEAPSLPDFLAFCRHQVDRLNHARPGMGGLMLNELTAQFVKPPLGASAIPPERRREYMAKVEALA